MLLIDMARRGRGLTWAPGSLVADDLATGRIVRAGPADWDIPIDVCLFRARARLTNAVEPYRSSVLGQAGSART